MRPAGSSRSRAELEGPSPRPSEVAFEPARLGRGSGPPDRARIVAALAVVFVGLAVVKPWEGAAFPSNGADASVGPSADVAGGIPSPPGDSPSTGDPPPPSVPPRPAWPGFGPPTSGAAIGWDDAIEALRHHDGWGVRALVDAPNDDGGIRPAYASLAERWKPAAPAVDGALGGSLAGAGTVSEAVVMPTGGQPVRALGVTAPADRTPLELRAWWLPGNGAAPRWLDVRPVDPNVAGGHLLLLPPRLPDGPASRWPAGSYRFDLLLGPTVTRLTIILPHDGTLRGGAEFETVPELVVDPLQADLGALPAGPFVVAGGVAIPVGTTLGPTIDEAAAWLDAVSPEDGLGAVAEVWLPGLNGIGQVLPVGARLEWAALERIAPAGLVGVDAAARPITDVRGRSSTVLFSPPRAEPWPAGTYALDVRWTEDGVQQAGRWHVVVLPGPARRTGAWTTLARSWARHAGTWGIVTGTANPLRGGPAAVAIRFMPQAPGSARVNPTALGDRCTGGTVVDASRPVVGIAHPVDAVVRSVRLERRFVEGRRLAQPVAIAPNVVPGLSIVGPPAETPWPPGFYRVVVDTAVGESSLVVCLAEAGRSGLRVSPATASAEAYLAAQAASTTR